MDWAVVEYPHEIVMSWETDRFVGRVFNILQAPEVPFLSVEGETVEELALNLGYFGPWVDVVHDDLEADRLLSQALGVLV